MIGAIAGDVIGSVHEFTGRKDVDFPLFTPESRFSDDTVLTVATAAAILGHKPYEATYLAFGRRYPDVHYGAGFTRWLRSWNPRPYKGRDNGAAMRVSPVGFAFKTRDDVLREAERSAAGTHNHPEGIRGAQAAALAVYLARTGATKEEIREGLTRRFAYDLERTVAEIRGGYRADTSCQGSVPEAIVAFLDSADFEDAVRLAVSLGGDADTQAAIAGAIAQAFYRHIPARIVEAVRCRLPADFLDVIDRFEQRFRVGEEPEP